MVQERQGRPSARDRRIRAGAQRSTARLRLVIGSFAVGSVAQGTPLVVVAVALERGGAPATWLAALAVARLAPYLVCSPLAGRLVARVPAARILRASLAVRAVLLAALGVALHLAAPETVLVATTFALVAAGTPAYPAAMRLVHDAATDGQDRARLAAMSGSIESASFWVGPAIGGLVVGLPAAVLAVPAGLLVVGALAVRPASVSPIVRAAAPVVAGATPAGSRQEDVVAVRDGPPHGADVRVVVGASLVMNVLAGMLAVLLVRLPIDAGLGGARTYGALAFAQGAGALAVALVLVTRAPRVKPVAWVLLAGSALSVLGATRALPIAVLACATFGAAVLASEVGASVALAGSLPSSRVATGFGLLDSALVLSMTVGSLLAPVVVAALGTARATAAVGFLVASVAALGVVCRSRTAVAARRRPPRAS